MQQLALPILREERLRLNRNQEIRERGKTIRHEYPLQGSNRDSTSALLELLREGEPDHEGLEGMLVDIGLPKLALGWQSVDVPELGRRCVSV